MTSEPAGWIVAWSFPSADEWTVTAGYARKPSADAMRQTRQAFARRGCRVRMFTQETWDALPIGHQAGDWVWIGNGRTPSGARD